MIFELIHKDTDAIVVIFIAKVIIVSIKGNSGVCDNVPEGEDVTQEARALGLQRRDAGEGNFGFEFPCCGAYRLKRIG